MTSDQYLSVLNPEQKEAVVHEGSPLLILAGAGSGKTRVVTTKIAYLISEKHVDPFSILAVTFTKKAANEMKERAVALEKRAAWAQIRTFHSFGASFLRTYAKKAGISPDFTVYDDDDVVTLILKSNPGLTRTEASRFAHKISLAKDYCLEYDSSELSLIEDNPQFPQIYKNYQERLRQTGNLDFGDLIMLPYLVLSKNEEVRSEIHCRYRVIMVDEYQDSNVAQFLLLKELSGVEENSKSYVCVVGDDDQSIYKFRGAEVKNILNFQQTFPNTRLVRLETNYRSTKEILDCASSLVCHNKGRLGKNLKAFRGEGKKPALVFLPDQKDEAMFCADLIEISHEKGFPYSDWAILYRTNAQSLAFETEFLHRKIPYRIVGSLKFYEREEIKDTLAWLSFIANPRDEIAFRRIVNKPVRGIGEVSQDRIIDFSRTGCLEECLDKVKLTKKAREGFKAFLEIYSSLLKMLPETSSYDDLSEEEIAEEKNTEGLSAVELAASINSSRGKEKEEKKSLASFIEELIVKSGLEEYHKSQDEISGSQKLANLQSLVNSSSLYSFSRKGLLKFLDNIELDKSLELEDEETEKDFVTLITLHNTKGLEFNKVIITGMERGVFPREDKSGDELEEERRLFYVGITRARDELYFTSCSVRMMYGRSEWMTPSPFLYEMGKNNFRILGQKPASFVSSEACLDPIAKKWKKGLSVYSDDWGHGQIVKAFFREGEWVIEVKFENGGTKSFLPKYQEKALDIEN